MKNLKDKYKVPHIGWNKIFIKRKNFLFDEIEDKFFLAHSYTVLASKKEFTISTTNYIEDFSSAVCNDNVYGVQFHPEKVSIKENKLLKILLKNVKKKNYTIITIK